MSTRIINADVMDGLSQLGDESVHCVVTSPPYYGLRDYGIEGQIGLEATPDEYVAKMVDVFREVRRVLRKDGTCWLNLGDSYVANRGNSKQKPGFDNKAADGHGSLAVRDYKIPGKPKDLIGIPWRVAFALQADGWWLRQDIIWSKPNPMPESVTDRCTKAHEYLFLLTKAERYFYDAGEIAEAAVYASEVRVATPKNVGGLGLKPTREYGHQLDGNRNKRSVWTVSTQSFPEAHFATFPPALIEPCIRAGCPSSVCPLCLAPSCHCADGAPECFVPRLEAGTVLDPFGGAGTTGLVADRLKRNAILIELNPEYAAMAEKRIKGDCPMFADVA